jgi:hypothetical protein
MLDRAADPPRIDQRDRLRQRRHRDRQRRYAARQRRGVAVYRVEADAAVVDALVTYRWLRETEADNHERIAAAMSEALRELGHWHHRP